MKEATAVGCHLGDHICCVYKTRADMLSISMSFIKAGLMSDEHCAIVTRIAAIHHFKQQLKGSGFNVDRLERYGQLTFRSRPTDDLPHEIFEELTHSDFRGYRSLVTVSDLMRTRKGAALVEQEVLMSKLLGGPSSVIMLLYDQEDESNPMAAEPDRVTFNVQGAQTAAAPLT